MGYGTCAALALFAGAALAGGAEQQKSGKTGGKTPVAEGRFRRGTPTVLAVRATRGSIVALKVAKPGARTDTVGTGVIAAERGYLVTHRHVIARGTASKVTVLDG